MKAALVLLLLVGMAASLHVQKNSCSCIPWKSAYKDHNVLCGQGYELATGSGSAGPELAKMGRLQRSAFITPGTVTNPMGKAGVWESNSEKFPNYYSQCETGYPALSFAGCLNKQFGTPTQQWCYVSQDCKGADAVEGTDVAIKECTDGDDDDIMNETTPLEVNKLAQENLVDPSWIGNLVWPTEPEEWEDVEAATGMSHEKMRMTHIMEYVIQGRMKWKHEKEVTQAKTDKLQAIKASGVPTLFRSSYKENPGGMLIFGEKTYVFGPRTDGVESISDFNYVEMV